ncbi:MAG: hypothetical protein IPK85_08995 [Gemmatimonadetes bacterium]|nr:hypothetical protein [Gemmatimonadota bacterium]
MRWLPSGTFVVADLGASRLLVFDSTGTYRGAMGRIGDGPQEFRGLAAISAVKADTFAVFDGRRRRLTYWHPTAGYLGAVALVGDDTETGWPENGWAWGDSALVVLQMMLTPRDSAPRGPGVRPWRMQAQLRLINRAGELVRAGPTFQGTYTGLTEEGDMRLPFANTPFAALGVRRAYFGSGEDFALSLAGQHFLSGGFARVAGGP